MNIWDNNFKRTFITIVMFLTAVVFCCGFMCAESVYAQKGNLKVSAEFTKAKDPTSVTTTWKYTGTSKISYYRIYLHEDMDYSLKSGSFLYGGKSVEDIYGNTHTPIKSVKVSGKKNSYVFSNLKKNHLYGVSIYGFSKNKKQLAHNSVSITTGVYRVFYDPEECVTSPDQIKLTFYSNDTDFGYPSCGYTAGKYQIYRKAKGQNWRLVKTIKAKKTKYFYSYTDKVVSARETYEYKVRGVATVNNKTIKGPFSSVKLDAVNDTGLLNVAIDPATPAEKDMKTVELTLTSDVNNYDIRIPGLTQQGGYPSAYVNDEGICGGFTSVFMITDYKTEGGEWTPITDDLDLPAGGTISLRFQAMGENDVIDLTSDDSISFGGVKYGEDDYSLNMYLLPKKGVGSVYELL